VHRCRSTVFPCERMRSEARLFLNLMVDHSAALQPDGDLGRRTDTFLRSCFICALF
jgi:hypothetical protein